MIELQGINHFYGKFQALFELNLKIPQGTIAGFIGPNGAGKSTSLKILAGYLVPSRGTVIINGVNILEDPLQARSLLGYMPETPYLYSEMRVWEYLTYVGRLKGLPHRVAREKADSLIELLQLTRFRKRLVGNLSKGNRQRAALAQALVADPKVLLLDEPTSALDPHNVLEIRRIIKGLAGKTTVLMSSHILSEVQEMCDYLVMIRDGKIQYQGAIGQIPTQPSEQEVQLVFSELDDQSQLLIASLPGAKLLSEAHGSFVFSVHQEDIFFAQCYQLVVERKLRLRKLLSNADKLESLFT